MNVSLNREVAQLVENLALEMQPVLCPALYALFPHPGNRRGLDARVA